MHVMHKATEHNNSHNNTVLLQLQKQQCNKQAQTCVIADNQKKNAPSGLLLFLVFYLICHCSH